MEIVPQEVNLNNGLFFFRIIISNLKKKTNTYSRRHVLAITKVEKH